MIPGKMGGLTAIPSLGMAALIAPELFTLLPARPYSNMGSSYRGNRL